ncbi:MAG: anthranilate synthase component II [Myxococcota bacterium]
MSSARRQSFASQESPVHVVVLDSRDSFTYNLAQAFSELGVGVRVLPHDDIQAERVLSLRPRLVCIGPGPRGPAELPLLVDTCRALTGQVPLLGVCLGMQALALAHGGRVNRAERPVHGQRSPITHEACGLFSGLPSPLWVMRYHSLIVTDVPNRFQVDAVCDRGQAMAMSSPDQAIYAVQFHPESVGTSGGMQILHRALTLASVEVAPLAPERPGAIPSPTQAGYEVPHVTTPFSA